MAKQYTATITETDTETEDRLVLVDMTGDADIVALNVRFVSDKIAPRPKPGRRKAATAAE